MNKHKGFTIVEIVVVVTVLVILVTIASLGLNQYLADGRDSQRETHVTAIADHLERYYEANSEYPSCAAVTASAATVSTNTLKGIDTAVLVAPRAPSGTTNSIRCGTTLQATAGDDFYEYVGDGSGSCTGSSFCTQFTLRYREEASGTIKTLSSKRTV